MFDLAKKEDLKALYQRLSDLELMSKKRYEDMSDRIRQLNDSVKEEIQETTKKHKPVSVVVFYGDSNIQLDKVAKVEENEILGTMVFRTAKNRILGSFPLRTPFIRIKKRKRKRVMEKGG